LTLVKILLCHPKPKPVKPQRLPDRHLRRRLGPRGTDALGPAERGPPLEDGEGGPAPGILSGGGSPPGSGGFRPKFSSANVVGKKIRGNTELKSFREGLEKKIMERDMVGERKKKMDDGRKEGVMNYITRDIVDMNSTGKKADWPGNKTKSHLCMVSRDLIPSQWSQKNYGKPVNFLGEEEG